MYARTLSPLLALTILAAGCGGSSTSTTTTPPPSPAANLSSADLTFTTTTIGTTSAAQPITLSSAGTAALSITSISTSGDFVQTNNCPAALASAATCIIQITFKPTAAGTRTGTLTVTDNASTSPQSAGLSGTGAASGSTGLPNTFFAITVNALNSGTSWPATVPFGTAGKASSGSYWANLETARGTYTWTPLDNYIDSALAVGITNIDYSFFQTPQWASSNPTQTCSATSKTGILGCAAPPTSLQDWNDFVTAVVTRYKGKIQYYEIWNEPDVTSEYSGPIPEMVSLAQSAYSIIKSIDPNAMVLTPSVSFGGVLSSNPTCGSSTCWLAAYLSAGGSLYADGVTIHGKACDSTTSLCVSNNIACPPNALQQCAGQPLVQQIVYAQNIMANNGLAGKPLINTEGGYADTVATNDLPNATADQQAAYVSRFYIVQASQGMPFAVYFSWLSNQSLGLSGFGTTTAFAENNQAYQQTYTWLVGSTFNGPCTQDSNRIWTCSLTLAGAHPALLVWSDSATTYTPTGSYTSYQTVLGVTSPIANPVPIGILPILLH